MKVKNVGFRRDREFAEPRASAPICLLHWVGWSRGSDASSFFYVAKFAPEQTFNMQFQNLSETIFYLSQHPYFESDFIWEKLFFLLNFCSQPLPQLILIIYNNTP